MLRISSSADTGQPYVASYRGLKKVYKQVSNSVHATRNEEGGIKEVQQYVSANA